MDKVEKVPEKDIDTSCIVCGHIADDSEIRPAEEDLQEFVRSLLGNRPFVKEYKLYEGRYILEFRSLTSKDSARLGILLNKLAAEYTDLAVIKQRALELKLIYYLNELNGDPIIIPDSLEVANVKEEYDKFFGKIGEAAISLCVTTLVQFLYLQKLLIEEGYDANFWKGAGLR